MGVDVALVDVLPAPAVRVLGPRVGQLLAELHAAHGVELHLGVGVTRGEGGRVSLDQGDELDADVVLESLGAVPDTAWLESSGVRLDDGVMCDEHGRAMTNVYAVEDVARWNGHHRHEHWTNVGQQADHVAAVILGQDHPASDVAYWWSDQYDVKLQGLGTPRTGDDVELVTWGPKSRPLAVYSHRGRLTGVVGFSAAAAIMRLRPDIAAGAEVTEVLARLIA